MKSLLLLTLATCLMSVAPVGAAPPKSGDGKTQTEVLDPKKLLAKYDENKDGKLDQKEFSKLLRSLKHNSLTSKMLPKYDKDGDGKLNLEELTAMLKDEK